MIPKLQHNLVTSAWVHENAHSGVDRYSAWPVLANSLAFTFCEY